MHASTARPRRTIYAVAMAATLLLGACGGSGTDSALPSGDASSDDASSDGGSVDSAGDASGDSAGNDAGDSPGGSVELATTPIPFRDLYDFRDGSEPTTRTEDVQLDECPLLSLNTLEASSGTYSKPTTLGNATALSCSFGNSPGTLTVTVEAAADVETDDHSGRAYNIDVEPIVEPQDGPGDKAVILIDTAFAETLGNDGNRYLYFFVLGDQAVTIRSTAFKVRDDGWRALADEVAGNLESGAAGGTVETVEVTDEVEPYTIEICGFVTIEQVAALTGDDPSTITTDHSPERYTCRWVGVEGLGFSYSFGSGLTHGEALSSGSPDLSGELDGILAAGDEISYIVWYLEDDPWSFTVRSDNEKYFSTADAIAINLFQRIEKPDPL